MTPFSTVSTYVFFQIRVGIGEFDKVGIISNNRNEWAIIAAACYSLRASLVPMYEAQLASDWSYILNDSGCSVVFCATDDIFERVQKEVFPQTPNLHASICLDADSDEPYSFTARMKALAPDTSTPLSLTFWKRVLL